MELTQAIRADFSNVNNVSFLRSQSIQETDNSTESKTASLDKIELKHSTQSSFSLNLTRSIQKISTIQVAQTNVSQSLQIVNDFENLIKNNSGSLNSVQPQIQSFISTFNNSSASLSENMSKIIEEKQSEDSRAYFDGILGSKPLSGEEIYQAIQGQKQRLEQYNRQLNAQQNEVAIQAQQSINIEKEESAFSKQFGKEISFEIESVKFEAKAIQSQTGSIVQTQANAEPYATTELVAAS